MNGVPFVIRDVTEDDAAALLAIYSPYVRDTAVSFEYDVPAEAEFAARIRAVLDAGYPYLAAVEDGVIVGYCYAGRFRARKAYDPSAEESVYVASCRRGHGIGSALLSALEPRLRARGVTNLYACVTWVDAEDEYLTHASPRFHERMGFTVCGRFTRCAVKFGRRYDMIFMEKHLGDGDTGDAMSFL